MTHVADELYFVVKPRCQHCFNFVKILGGKYLLLNPFVFSYLHLTSILINSFSYEQIIAEDEEAFDVLYCIAFVMMDAQWLAMRASYMDFNVLSLSLSLIRIYICVNISHKHTDILFAELILGLNDYLHKINTRKFYKLHVHNWRESLHLKTLIEYRICLPLIFCTVSYFEVRHNCLVKFCI